MSEGARAPTLLLVDDEVHILAALRRALRREGWRLLTAETPQQALRVLDEQPIDLILTDQKMPGMSGLDLLADAVRRRPQARRVLITGWMESVPPERLAALGVRALIPKPWDDAELKATLRAQLTGA